MKMSYFWLYLIFIIENRNTGLIGRLHMIIKNNGESLNATNTAMRYKAKQDYDDLSIEEKVKYLEIGDRLEDEIESESDDEYSTGQVIGRSTPVTIRYTQKQDVFIINILLDSLCDGCRFYFSLFCF